MANLSGFTANLLEKGYEKSRAGRPPQSNPLVLRTANSKDVIPLSKICENCDVNIHPSSLCGVMKTIQEFKEGCPYCNTYNHIRWQELMQADIKFWQEYRESYV